MFISRSREDKVQFWAWVNPAGNLRTEPKEFAIEKGVVVTLWSVDAFVQALTFLRGSLRVGNRATQHLFTTH